MTRRPRTSRVLLALALALVPAGCATVSAGGFGPGLRDGDMAGGEVADFDREIEVVWARTKETLAHLSERVPQFDEDARSAYATVDGGSVRADASQLAPGRSRLVVKARRYGKDSPELARSVLGRIADFVER